MKGKRLHALREKAVKERLGEKRMASVASKCLAAAHIVAASFFCLYQISLRASADM